MKTARVYKKFDKMGNIRLTARAGKKGKGHVLAVAQAWDNPRAEEQAWNNIDSAINRQGYERVDWEL